MYGKWEPVILAVMFLGVLCASSIMSHGETQPAYVVNAWAHCGIAFLIAGVFFVLGYLFGREQ